MITFRFVRMALYPSRRQVRPRRRGGSQRRAALAALASFVVVALAFNAGAMYLLDDRSPGLRDPEYARRVERYRDRVAENPGRPAVLVVGSSRSAMGVCPSAWEAVRGPTDPLLFNMSLLGSGPVMELLVVRRAFADGLRPRVVLLEYWPPFLYSEDSWSEWERITVERLSPRDRSVVGDYFPEHVGAESRMTTQYWNPFWESRERLLIQVVPKWLRGERRIDWTWDTIDAWGWKPGFDLPPGESSDRGRMVAACRQVYQPLLANYRISGSADRALREAVALARAHGATVGMLYLPESTEFRALYPPSAEKQARDYLAAISRELAVPVIDAREWMDDGLLVDGFHLSRVGAAEFTRRLGPAIRAAFAEVRP
jgi:hypothetical protein